MLNNEQLERASKLFQETIIPAMKEAGVKNGKKTSDIAPLTPEVSFVFQLENGQFAQFEESYGRHQPILAVSRLAEATLIHTEAERDYYDEDMRKYEANGLSHDEDDGGSDMIYFSPHPVIGVRSVQMMLL